MENELSFKITTAAELAGAQATATALEMQIGKAKALKQDYSALQSQLDTVRASMANLPPELQKLQDAHEAAGKGAEKEFASHHALHMLFHEMGQQSVPFLGHALIDMMMGPLAPALLLGSTFEFVKGQVEDWNTMMGDVASNAAIPQFAAGIEAQKKAFDDAAESIGKYTTTIAQLAQHEITIAQALSSQLELMRAIAQQEAATRAAREAAAKAETERMAKAGEITPEQKIIKETEGEVKAARDDAEAKRNAAVNEVQAKQDALSKAALAQAGLDADATAKEQAVAQDKAHRERLQSDYGMSEEDYRKKQKELINAQDDAQAQLQQSEFEAKAGGMSPEAAAQYTADARTILEEAQAELQNFEKGRKQFEATQTPGALEHTRKLEEAAQTAQDKGKENAKTVDTLTRETQDARAQLEAVQKGIADELAQKIAKILSDAVTKLYDTTAGGEVLSGIKAATMVEHGQPLNDAQAQFLMALDKVIGDNATTLKGAADKLYGIRDNTSAFIQAVDKVLTDIKDQVALLKAQINSGT